MRSHNVPGVRLLTSVPLFSFALTIASLITYCPCGVQVRWNTMVLPEQTGYPTHCLGALLTTHRALVTDGHLTAFCSVPLLEADLAATHAVTSMLWAGPALLPDEHVLQARAEFFL